MPFDNKRFDLVDTYCSVLANTPLKMIIYYLVLAVGTSLPYWIGGEVFEWKRFLMWPTSIYLQVLSWGIVSGILALVGIALVVCLFGCLYKYLVTSITLKPLFHSFSICYLLCIREADPRLWIAIALFVVLLAGFIWLPPVREIREYENKLI